MSTAGFQDPALIRWRHSYRILHMVSEETRGSWSYFPLLFRPQSPRASSCPAALQNKDLSTCCLGQSFKLPLGFYRLFPCLRTNCFPGVAKKGRVSVRLLFETRTLSIYSAFICTLLPRCLCHHFASLSSEYSPCPTSEHRPPSDHCLAPAMTPHLGHKRMKGRKP